MQKMGIKIILGLMLIWTASISVNAATFVVNTTADTADATAGNGICADAAGSCSLRAAITEANALAGADVITLPAGIYTQTLVALNENANAGGDYDLTSEITINGAGAGTTIVQAASARNTAIERVFHLRATGVATVINDITVRYGRYTTAAGTFGAGIRVDVGAVNATLTNVVVTENDNGTSGGGISVSSAVNAVLTLNNCTISNNTAGGVSAASSTGAGIMGNVATATININNSTVTGNSASNTSTTVSPNGGGISSIGILNLTNSTVSNNSVSSSGFNAFSGGLYIVGGVTTITGSTISGNTSTVTAGTGSALVGGVYNQQSTVSITNSVVTNNSVSNTATAGGAFHAGVRTLASTVAATTNITDSTISNNNAPGEGGGIVNFATSSANSTTNITRSTVSGNTTTGSGGGVLNAASTAIAGLSVINLTNSTVSSNSAANGAGIYNGGATATVNLNFATVARNTATATGGGLLQASGAINLKNSIVADNTATTGPDISGTITSQDYNHVENVSGGTFLVEPSAGRQSKKAEPSFLALANDVTGSDPQLSALGNYGGATQTHLPATTSPVVNAIPNGTNECGTTVTTDQRGVTRPAGAGCDKGSVEIAVAPTAAGADINGRVRTANGRGISNVVVTISGGTLSEPLQVKTTAFGYYRFLNLPSGQTYIIKVDSKRFVFQNSLQVITPLESLADVDFTAEPQ